MRAGDVSSRRRGNLKKPSKRLEFDAFPTRRKAAEHTFEIASRRVIGLALNKLLVISMFQRIVSLSSSFDPGGIFRIIGKRRWQTQIEFATPSPQVNSGFSSALLCGSSMKTHWRCRDRSSNVLANSLVGGNALGGFCSEDCRRNFM